MPCAPERSIIREDLFVPGVPSAFSLPEALETTMVGVVASWRCKCGIRVKVLAEVDPSQPPATQIASCPKCGDSQSVEGDKIVSVTEDIPDASLAFDSMHGSESSVAHCNEKEGLMLAHRKAFDIYLQKVSELAEAAGLVTHNKSELLYNRVQIARQLFVEARERLNQHTAQHGC